MFKSPTYRYMNWLAIADLTHLTFTVLYMTSAVETLHREFGYLLSWILCHTLRTLIRTFETWSYFMVPVFTCRRLRGVWDPFAFRIQKVKNYLVALGALFLSTVIHVVGSWEYELDRMYKPTGNGVECYACKRSAFHSKNIVGEGRIYGRELLSRVFPMLTVFLLNIVIVVIYRHRLAQGRVLQPTKRTPDAEECRMTFQLLFIGITNVICMTPMSLLMVVMSLKECDASIDFEVFHEVANIFANTQSVCNFYLYFFWRSEVRQEFLEFLREMLPKVRVLCCRQPEGFRRSCSKV